MTDAFLCFGSGFIGCFFGLSASYLFNRFLGMSSSDRSAQVIRDAVEFISLDAMPGPSSYTYIRQSYALAIIQKALLCRYISGEQANQLTDDVLGVDEDAHHAA